MSDSEVGGEAKRKRARSFPGALASAADVDRTTKITVSVPSELANELRNAVIYRQSHGKRVTMKSLLVAAAEQLLDDLRDEIGGPIPQRPDEYDHLMTGAPPGARHD